MGYSAGLYVIPGDKFARALEKGTWDRYAWHKCRPWFDLGCDWRELDEILEGRDEPLSYAIQGNVQASPDEPGFNFVSPDVVRQIAAALTKPLADEVIEEIEREHGGSWAEKDRRAIRRGWAASFDNVRKAYATAAASGAAVGILIC